MTIVTSTESELPKPEKYVFSPTGFKKHLLVDNAIVFITDNPKQNTVVYTHDYFDIKRIWTGMFSGLNLDRALSKLHGREDVYIDYDQKKIGIRGLTPAIDGLALIISTMSERLSSGMSSDDLELHTDQNGHIVWIEDKLTFDAR